MLHIILIGQVWNEAKGGNKDSATTKSKMGYMDPFLLSKEKLVGARLTK